MALEMTGKDFPPPFFVSEEKGGHLQYEASELFRWSSEVDS